MDLPGRYKIVVLSDLHLSEGWDEEGFLSKNEDFFFDCNFRRFVEYLCNEAKKGEFYYKLVINGDFVHFLQFRSDHKRNEIDGEVLTKREQTLGPGTTEKKTLWKLKRLIGGHSVFFCALADFVSQGNELLIIPGNHDIEWIMPKLQEAFRQELQTLCAFSTTIRERIKFLPWFYWDPALSVFIEHGSQYDDINSFDYLLCPYREDETIDLPAGSFFVRYLFNRLEEIYPFADNMKPLMGAGKLGPVKSISINDMSIIGQKVLRVGRTTGLRRGTIAAFGYEYTDDRDLTAYTDLLIVGDDEIPFSTHGDSGSLIVTNDEQLNPIGLLWGGWQEKLRTGHAQENWTYGIALSRLLDSLEIDIVSSL